MSHVEPDDGIRRGLAARRHGAKKRGNRGGRWQRGETQDDGGDTNTDHGHVRSSKARTSVVT
jgi:hypothetical protein